MARDYDDLLSLCACGDFNRSITVNRAYFGETAPLLFTALSNQFTSFDMNGPMANIPIVIYQFAASPFQDWNELAWAGATLITLFVLLLNIFARIFFHRNPNKNGRNLNEYSNYPT